MRYFKVEMESGRKFAIRFYIEDGCGAKWYCREVIDNHGMHKFDKVEFDIFDENLTVDDWVQWTIDNFCEITELMEV